MSIQQPSRTFTQHRSQNLRSKNTYEDEFFKYRGCVFFGRSKSDRFPTNNHFWPIYFRKKSAKKGTTVNPCSLFWSLVNSILVMTTIHYPSALKWVKVMLQGKLRYNARNQWTLRCTHVATYDGSHTLADQAMREAQAKKSLKGAFCTNCPRKLKLLKYKGTASQSPGPGTYDPGKWHPEPVRGESVKVRLFSE